MHLKDEQGRYTSKTNSTEQLEQVDNHVYDECGAYNDLDEHFCMLHHNPHCHYHQSIQKRNICNKHEAQLNSDVEFSMNNDTQDPPEDVTDTEKLNPHDFMYNRDVIVSVNKDESAKIKTIKCKNTIPSNTDEERNVYKESCAHCHCPIKSAFTRQIIDINGSLERKESSDSCGQIRCFVNNGDYGGNILYMHLVHTNFPE